MVDGCTYIGGIGGVYDIVTLWCVWGYGIVIILLCSLARCVLLSYIMSGNGAGRQNRENKMNMILQSPTYPAHVRAYREGRLTYEEYALICWRISRESTNNYPTSNR